MTSKDKQQNTSNVTQPVKIDVGGPEQISLAENESDFIVGEESEPYLGPSWALLMLVLFFLKQLFPAETYSTYWYFQIYILLIVMGITLFTLIKRHRFFKSDE